MKQPIKFCILLIAVSVAFTRCHDEAIKIDSHFIGVWNGTDGTYTYRLSIDNHSNGYWEQDKGGRYEYARGIARVRSSKLSVGLKTFEINQYPAQDSAAAWTMTLSGIAYQKQ